MNPFADFTQNSAQNCRREQWLKPWHRRGQSNSESAARIQIACSCGDDDDDSDNFGGGNPNVTKDGGGGVIPPHDDCRRND